MKKHRPRIPFPLPICLFLLLWAFLSFIAFLFFFLLASSLSPFSQPSSSFSSSYASRPLTPYYLFSSSVFSSYSSLPFLSSNPHLLFPFPTRFVPFSLLPTLISLFPLSARLVLFLFNSILVSFLFLFLLVPSLILPILVSFRIE